MSNIVQVKYVLGTYAWDNLQSIVKFSTCTKLFKIEKRKTLWNKIKTKSHISISVREKFDFIHWTCTKISAGILKKINIINVI